MKIRIYGEEDIIREEAKRLETELRLYEKSGVFITANGYEVEVNRGLTNMLLREGDCTYMRNYSFDDEGKITGISFEKVKLE